MAEQVKASHILLMYAGSSRSTATRSKEEAAQQIEDLKGQVDGGADLAELAREINGQEVDSGRQLPGYGALKDDGSTRCGNWLYAGSYTEAGNQMARRGQEDPTGLGLYDHPCADREAVPGCAA